MANRECLIERMEAGFLSESTLSGQPHMSGQVLHCIVSDAPEDGWCTA